MERYEYIQCIKYDKSIKCHNPWLLTSAGNFRYYRFIDIIIFFSECPLGQKKVGDSCERCPTGTYRSFADPDTECLTCPEGTTGTGLGQISCSMCQYPNNKFEKNEHF